MWKPVLLLAAIMLAVGVGTCTLNRTVIQRDATGRPMDIRGTIAACPRCKTGLAVWQGTGYEFKCEDCGAQYRLRWNADDEIETDW